MLVAKNIHKNYGELEILKGIDITINKKEIACIVGASGAGKTTLLQILGTLDLADQGELLIHNEQVLSLKKNQLSKFRNKNIGFVFQFHQLLVKVFLKKTAHSQKHGI